MYEYVVWVYMLKTKKAHFKHKLKKYNLLIKNIFWFK